MDTFMYSTIVRTSFKGFCKKLYGIEQRVGRLKKFTGDLKACVVQIKVVCDRNKRKRTMSLIFEWI